uniref:Solute carrier family 47 member 3 n=1 Tax=Seriola dumerili TaxID=41447 RepID=A0A3B4UDC3_SERDU
MESSTQSSPLSSWSDCFVLKRIRMLVPVGFKTEVKELSKLAGPVVSSVHLLYSHFSTIFCGHLGKTELASVSLAIATFGSGNFLRVGVIMQRAILILILACFPCWAILINTEPILLAVRQEPEVARSAVFKKPLPLPLLATFMYSLETKYLQNQGIIWPQVITGFVVNLLNALINYVVLHALKLGVAGSAVANTISQFAMAGILYAYIMWRGLHKATWGGWSKECMQNWGSFIHLAIPGMVMLCVEWWTYEIGAFLAGLISEVELGAQSVVYQLANIAYMFPIGFSVAGSVRVGNALGAGETEQAKLSAKMSMFCSGQCALTHYLILFVHILFFPNRQIRERVADVISFYAPVILLDAISGATSGIIQGAGKQRVGAICNTLGYYGIGFPIGVPLMFAAKLGIKGKIHSRDVLFSLYPS